LWYGWTPKLNALVFMYVGFLSWHQACCAALWQEEQRRSLVTAASKLDGALGNLVWWKVTLPMAEGLELEDL